MTNRSNGGGKICDLTATNSKSPPCLIVKKGERATTRANWEGGGGGRRNKKRLYVDVQ